MQINSKSNIGKKSIYHASDAIFHSLPRYRPYNEIPDLIMINILNYNAIDHYFVKRVNFENNDE